LFSEDALKPHACWLDIFFRPIGNMRPAFLRRSRIELIVAINLRARNGSGSYLEGCRWTSDENRDAWIRKMRVFSSDYSTYSCIGPVGALWANTSNFSNDDRNKNSFLPRVLSSCLISRLIITIGAKEVEIVI